jgi:hypothetical protein
MTAELAEEILEDDFDSRVSQQVDDLFKDLPEEARNMNKFILAGGTMQEYMATLNDKPVGVTRGMDLAEASNQEAIVRNQLKSDDFDDEYITSQIQYLKDSGMLEKTATTHYKKWEAKDKTSQEALLERQAEAKRADKDNRKKERAGVSDYINKTVSVKGFNISRNDKKDLPNYMSEKSVKYENGTEMTPMHRDLYAAMSDPETSVVLAKLLRNKFDFTKLKQAAVTEKVKGVKDNVRRSSTSTPSANKGRGGSQKSLADRLAGI